jgi:DNA-binding CsgD family transcriptional regulator
MNPPACASFVGCLQAAGSESFPRMLIANLSEFNRIDDCLLVEIGRNGEMMQHFSTHQTRETFGSTVEEANCLRLFAASVTDHDSGAHVPRGTLVDSSALRMPDTVGSSRQIPAPLFVIGSCAERTWVLGLYRHANRSAFSDSDKTVIASLANMLAALADIHLRLSARRGVSPQIEHAWKAVLSERERAVATLFARGETARMIADRLGLAQTSVITYKKRAFLKLGVSRQCELTALVGALQ